MTVQAPPDHIHLDRRTDLKRLLQDAVYDIAKQATRYRISQLGHVPEVAAQEAREDVLKVLADLASNDAFADRVRLSCVVEARTTPAEGGS